MDGYAVATRDLDTLPTRLRVVGESRTGAVAGAMQPGGAMRIFTGAGVPAGADAVVMQENVTRDGDYAVFTQRPRVGHHIRMRGEDLRAGTKAIAKGTR